MEEDYFFFSSGEGERRVEGRVKKNADGSEEIGTNISSKSYQRLLYLS